MENYIKDIEQYYTFQKKEWLALRIFWFIMGLVLTAAAFGFFGKGMISDKSIISNGIQVDYNKYLRAHKETEILLQVPNLGENAKVSINNDYLKKIKVDQIVPEPASVEIKDGQLVYTFHSIRNGFITFYLTPQSMGSQTLDVTVNGTHMRLQQFIYF